MTIKATCEHLSLPRHARVRSPQSVSFFSNQRFLPQARFLLRFLFKKAALFREAEIRGRTQVELQKLAIESETMTKEQAVSALRR